MAPSLVLGTGSIWIIAMETAEKEQTWRKGFKASSLQPSELRSISRRWSCVAWLASPLAQTGL